MKTAKLWVNEQGKSQDAEKYSVCIQNKALSRSRPLEFYKNCENCPTPYKNNQHETTTLIRSKLDFLNQ